MELIQVDTGSIMAGVLIVAALAFMVYRIVNRIRNRKTGCGCTGCLKCP
ncbi:MAG: FeoB-associated Cys-rich membrane protein [Treponema sp.]|jgi:hypothetical protein|nr:FeoB-associated Cys-rich membrane protein [Treponema sp.]